MGMTATTLYAKIHNQHPSGPFECFWCGNPCNQFLILPPEFRPIITIRKAMYSKRPSSKYYCIGCWLFRRQRITVNFLSGGYKDSQSPQKFSWLFTTDQAFAIRMDNGDDRQRLYEVLLDPPRCFMLSLITELSEANRIQYGLVNEVEGEIQNGVNLKFTIDHAEMEYTPYELEMGLDNPDKLDGIGPGVRRLMELLGDYKMPKSKIEQKLAIAAAYNPKGGRRLDEKINEKSFKKVVRLSGK